MKNREYAFSEITGQIYLHLDGRLVHAGTIVPGRYPPYGEGFFSVTVGQKLEDADHYKRRDVAVSALLHRAQWRAQRNDA